MLLHQGVILIAAGAGLAVLALARQVPHGDDPLLRGHLLGLLARRAHARVDLRGVHADRLDLIVDPAVPDVLEVLRDRRVDDVHLLRLVPPDVELPQRLGEPIDDNRHVKGVV